MLTQGPSDEETQIEMFAEELRKFAGRSALVTSRLSLRPCFRVMTIHCNSNYGILC